MRVNRKEVAWKKVLGAIDENVKDVWKFTKKKQVRLKGVYITPRKMFMNSLEGR